MIDLHCHILPGLDDGPRDLADSVTMARQGERDGVTTICATPHIRHDHDVRIAELPDRVGQVNEALRAAGCRTRVATGGEVAETIVEHLTDAELHAVSLGGGGRWILLEPAPGPLSEGLDAAVVRLRRRGFRSLVAHPERHVDRDMYRRLATLTRDGALTQVTAETLTEPPASIGMLALARAGLVHLLGSDSHSPTVGRPVRLSHGLAVLAEVDLLRPHRQWISGLGPAAVVAGQDMDPPFAPVG